MRFGVQLFGANPYFLEDKEGFLKRMKAAGYRYLEPVLSIKPNEMFKTRVWLPEDFAANIPLLKQYGFGISSCHIFTSDLCADMADVFALAKQYGITTFVVGSPACNSMEAYEKAAENLRKAAKAFAAEGLELLLHNGEDCSLAKVGDVCAYEWMLNACPEIGAQADVGWLLVGGVDPESFLWRHKSQVKSLHYKDMELVDGVMKETGVGTGLVDMVGCFQFGRGVEIIQIVDQDSTKEDFLKDLEYAGGLLGGMTQVRDNTKSILCTMNVETGEVTELKTFDSIIEAPNWYAQNPDFLFYNSNGLIYRYCISTGESAQIPSGICDNCNNDHVLSPDGTKIAVSHSGSFWKTSKVYIFPIEGGEPVLITENEPSFLHGWSPDGKELAYCGFRFHGDLEDIDIYAIDAEGGEERRLTDFGFNDGPEYSPDGEYIWFISTRTGFMQNFRMKRDGSEQTQMTFCERNNWFGHISPDCKKVVYLSYSKDGLDPNEHLANMPVQLRMMNFDGTDDKILLEVFGGQGTLNVNSWHPDSKQFAFVKYELQHKYK